MSSKAIYEALKAGAKLGKPLKKAVTDFIDDDFPLGTFDDKPFSKLKEQGVTLKKYKDLNENQKNWCNNFFTSSVESQTASIPFSLFA